MDLEITPVQTYFLDLLDMKYVNLNRSFIGKDGMVYFNLNQEKLPVPNIIIKNKHGIEYVYSTVNDILTKVIFATTFYKNAENNSERLFVPRKNNEYYIQFNPQIYSIQGNQGEIESFAIRYGSKIYAKSYEYVKDTLYDMFVLEHPDYSKYAAKADVFKNSANEWIKNKIQKILFDSNVVGTFINDSIRRDTYFQVRKDNDNLVFYVIYQWWKKLHKGKVTWVDIVDNQRAVFVALND